MESTRITRAIAERMPWHLSNREIAESYGVSSRVVWQWRTKLQKLNVPCRKGPDRKDRTHWDWSLPVNQLAKIHGVTRQRVHQIKAMMAPGKRIPAARFVPVRW